MMQYEIRESGKLHREDGTLLQTGYSFSPRMTYDRQALKVARRRIKEWDRYLISDDEYALSITLADLGHLGFLSISLIDHVARTSRTQNSLVALPLGKMGLPGDSESGEISFSNHQASFSLSFREGKRYLKGEYGYFERATTLYFNALLDDEPRDSMNLVVPWSSDKDAFSFTRKIVGLSAQGSFRKGREVHGFTSTDSFALLDWGRGVWPFETTWFWGYGMGWQEGGISDDADALDSHRFGLNLAYGLGDTTDATENMFLIDGKGYKLGEVDFGVVYRYEADKKKRVDYISRLMGPWHITDSDGLLDLVFTPYHDCAGSVNLAMIVSDRHQVFGEFEGKVVAEGKDFSIAGLKGAIELVHNKY